LRALPEFLMGVLLERVWRAGHFQRLPVVPPLLPLTAWLAIAVMPQDFSILFDLAVVVLACPLLVGLLVRSDAQSPAWFVSLGGISYPLYASHQAWIALAQHSPLFGLNHHPDPLRALAVLAASLLTAWVLYRTLDPAGRTGTRGLARFLAGKPALGACEARPKTL
jgi:peptidoglycan/LPS O-acetylase OafA/YrhL